MIDIVTYQTINSHNPNYTWLAYVVLPNGEFWNIRFNGATEDIARHRAALLWEKESDKVLARMTGEKEVDEASIDPWASTVRGQYAIGTIWMRHATEGLKRVTLTEITMYEERGYVRGGPRSK